MHTRSSRVTDLDPSILRSKIDLVTSNEVMIGRYISMLYMATFNFWSAIECYINDISGKGLSGEKDYYREADFEKSMLGRGLDREIIVLSLYRNACDHRINNPANKIVFSPKRRSYSNLQIDSTKLREKVLLGFVEILNFLKTEYNIP